MKKVTLFLATTFSAVSLLFGQGKEQPTCMLEKHIIELEKTALEEWNNGNPDGYLKIYAEDITYFDPYLNRRIDGFEAIKKLYDDLRGQVSVDRYEMINPVVQVNGNTAILTYNLYSYVGDEVYKWNCTEVFRLEPNEKWKIAHCHWSYIQPMNMK